MDVEEFLQSVASESPRAIKQKVWATPADVLAKAATSGGITMDAFRSAHGGATETREMRYGHVLGAGASAEAIKAWQTERSSLPLPADLRMLLARVNGIHLWAHLETGRSYSGIAPIEEWDLARIKMYGRDANRSLLDDRYIAISYHQDGAAFVVLDIISGRYFLMDSAGPDETTPIGSNVGELLDWLWKNRIPPRTD